MLECGPIDKSWVLHSEVLSGKLVNFLTPPLDVGDFWAIGCRNANSKFRRIYSVWGEWADWPYAQESIKGSLLGHIVVVSSVGVRVYYGHGLILRSLHSGYSSS